MIARPYCKRSAASYMSMSSALMLSIAKMTSPDTMPAFSAGPPGAADITESPAGDPLSANG